MVDCMTTSALCSIPTWVTQHTVISVFPFTFDAHRKDLNLDAIMRYLYTFLSAPSG